MDGTKPICSGFTEAKFLDAYPTGIEFHYWNEARNRIVRRLLSSMIDRSWAVLDIGCGTGIVTDYLRRRAINCRGCDIAIAPACSSAVAEHLQLGINAFELPDDVRLSVKLILLLDVLEHIERPRAFLSRCVERFPNLRRVLLSVPARMELWSNYDEYYGHHKRYDHRSLDELFEAGQFELERWGYFFHLLYPLAHFLKLLRRKRRTKVRPPRLPLVHNLIAHCFNVEQILVSPRLPGTSIYVALRVRGNQHGSSVSRSWRGNLAESSSPHQR